MAIKKREIRKKQPFLTGDPARDGAAYRNWARSPHAWRPPEEVEALKRWNALSMEEREKFYPRETESYIEQLLYERTFPGRHFDSDMFHFCAWLNEMRKEKGYPEVNFKTWKNVPEWQKKSREVGKELKRQLGLDASRAYPCIFFF